MKVSGFTFVRNAIKFDYPIVEAITSVLPLCDEFIVLLGNSNDGTKELIESIGSAKIKIIPSVWEDSLRKKGKTFSIETNKAFQAVSKEAQWAFYIQADEVLHEKFHEPVLQAMHRHKNDVKVEGLLFDYLHFYGSYDYVGDNYSWYRKEVRIIRNDKNIISYRDAQGFRKPPKRKLRVKQLDAFIYHYGWVRHPATMQRKQISNSYFSFSDQWVEKNFAKASEFDYSKIDSLKLFKGEHPQLMKPRIKRKNWQFDYDISKNTHSLKNSIKKWILKWTGWHIGEFRNYKVI